ncbi:hypothetical protein D3C78_983510 [compost metagenome]
MKVAVSDAALLGALNDHHVLGPQAADHDGLMAVLEDDVRQPAHVGHAFLGLGRRSGFKGIDFVGRCAALGNAFAHGGGATDVGNQQRFLGQRIGGTRLAPDDPANLRRLDGAVVALDRAEPEHYPIRFRAHERPSRNVPEVAGLVFQVTNRVIEKRAFAAGAAGG